MGRKKTYVREDVLNGAMGLFWRQGYAGTNLAELVQETGLNRFSLYNEFGGKEGLFLESLRRFLSFRRAEYRDSLAAQPAGIANIARYFRRLEYAEPDFGCFMFNTLVQKDSVPPDAYNEARALAEEAETLFRENLAAAWRAGDLDPLADVATLARMMMTLDQGLHSYGVLNLTHEQKDAVVAAALGSIVRSVY